MTLLLVMLHTGTMFAVIVYFWKPWRESFLGSLSALRGSVPAIAVATFFTGVVGFVLMMIIEKGILSGVPHAQVEQLFGNLHLIAGALAAAGVLTIIAGVRDRFLPAMENPAGGKQAKGAIATPDKVFSLNVTDSCLIGAVQGLCLPFRGFSRSGATISTGLILGMKKNPAEEFSFALAVVLTPVAISRELWRLIAAHHLSFSSLSGPNLSGAAGLLYPGLLGMGLSFISGLLALRWLSNWLVRGRWHFFGIYCLIAAAVVFSIQML
jgi:undecaprenyl-diphosphatase